MIFSVIGDWGRLGLHYERETGETMAKVLPSNAQSIICVGNKFYDYGVTSLNDELFQKSFKDVYTEPILKRLPCISCLETMTIEDRCMLRSNTRVFHHGGTCHHVTLVYV